MRRIAQGAERRRQRAEGRGQKAEGAARRANRLISHRAHRGHREKISGKITLRSLRARANLPEADKAGDEI